MIKRFFACMMLLSLVGCSMKPELVANSQTNSDKLSIMKVEAPSYLTPVGENKWEESTLGEGNQIILTFDKEVQEKQQAPFLLQDGQPLYLIEKGKEQNDKLADYSYQYKNNQLIVEASGGFPVGIIGIGLSGSTRGIKGEALHENIYIPFSTSMSNSVGKLEGVEVSKVLPLYKLRNDNKKYGFVNKDNAVSVSDNKGKSTRLFIGDSVEIVKEEGDRYIIHAYSRKDSVDPQKLTLKSNENIYDKKYCNVLTGKVQKKNISLIPNPVTEKTQISVFPTKLDSGSIVANLLVEVFPIGNINVLLDPSKVDKVNNETIAAIELHSRLMWDQNYGYKYYTTKQDNKGNILLENTKEAHFPENSWTSNELLLFKEFEKKHYTFLDKAWNGLKSDGKLREFNESFRKNIELSKILESTYIEWGIGEKYRDYQWYFTEVLNKSNQSSLMKDVNSVLSKYPPNSKFHEAIILLLKQNSSVLEKWDKYFTNIISQINYKSDEMEEAIE